MNLPPIPEEDTSRVAAKRSGSSLGAKIAIGLAIAFSLFLGVRVVQAVIFFKDRSRIQSEGEVEFRAANKMITAGRGERAFGNTPRATTLAEKYSQDLKDLRSTLFSKGKGDRDLLTEFTKNDFLTYCRITDEACVFLVQVPELRRFTPEAKEALGLLAWQTAQSVIKSGLQPSPKKVAVGLRGIINYDQIIIGRYVPEPSSDSSGIELHEHGLKNVSVLYPLFEDRAGKQ